MMKNDQHSANDVFDTVVENDIAQKLCNLQDLRG